MKKQLFKLSEVSNQINQDVVKSIMNPRSKYGEVYYRVRDGILVIICSCKVAIAEVERAITYVSLKMQHQKKRAPVKVNVFTYAN